MKFDQERLRPLAVWAMCSFGAVVVVYLTNQNIPDLKYISWAEAVIIGLGTYYFLRISHKLRKLQESNQTAEEK